MVQVSYPGVYIVEKSSGVKTITGVATSIGAFFGRTQKGQINKPVRCLSYADFLRAFGGAHPESELAASLKLFYDNGGTDCYVVRLAGAHVYALWHLAFGRPGLAYEHHPRVLRAGGPPDLHWPNQHAARADVCAGARSWRLAGDAGRLSGDVPGRAGVVVGRGPDAAGLGAGTEADDGRWTKDGRPASC